MICEWTPKLDLYVDGELSGGELTEVAAHLRTCPACAAGALGRLQLKRMNHAAGRRFSPSRELRAKISKRIEAEKRPRWTWRAWSWAPLLAAAAALVLVLIPSAFWLQHSRGDQALSELADLHVSTLASANPVDVLSSDRHTVKPWFQGKLPFTFNLPEQTSPFNLIGARLTYFRQSPGAQLLFEAGKHKISVFIFQNSAGFSGLNSGPLPGTKLAFNTETWAEGDLRYFVLGDASPRDVHDLSQLLRSANQ